MIVSEYIVDELVQAKSNLLELRNKVNESIEQIISALEKYGYDKQGNNIKTARDLSVADVLTDNKVWEDFPKAARPDRQILWLFENYFDKAVKLSEVQNKINIFNDRNVRIDNVARRLKREGRLVVVKYNKSNKMSYWGLPNWITKDDFNIKYRAEENKLPIDIYISEVIRK